MPCILLYTGPCYKHIILQQCGALSIFYQSFFMAGEWNINRVSKRYKVASGGEYVSWDSQTPSQASELGRGFSHQKIGCSTSQPFSIDPQSFGINTQETFHASAGTEIINASSKLFPSTNSYAGQCWPHSIECKSRFPFR